MSDSYAPWSIEIAEHIGDLDGAAQLTHLVSWAILSPNAHNSQPWRFVLDPSTQSIRVAVDEKGLTPASDPTGRQSAISLGCAAETLRVAAEAYGFDPSVELLDGDPREDGTVMAVVSVGHHGGRALSPEGRATLEAIRSRRVNRGKYSGEPLSPELVAALRESCADNAVHLNLVEDTSTRLAISELQYMAERAVIALPAFRLELADYFLPNDTSLGRGMPGNTFGLGDDVSARVHRDLGTKGVFNPDWAAGMAAASRDGLKTASVLAVISIDKDKPRGWVETGMCFQRCCLLAERNGLSVSVHASMVESKALNALLRTRLRRRARPTMVFRVGRATETRPHAPRLPVSQVSVLTSRPT